jgi:type I restriction enzyme, S subunit
MLHDVAFVQPPAGAEADRTRVRAGDVLLSITADLGRTAVIPKDLGPAHINQHLAILRVRDFDPRFLAAFISLGPGRQQLAKLDRVGVKSGLNFDDVRTLRIPMPPLPEQRRIADILDKADAIRRKRKEAIALTEELLRSAFLQMIGDPVTNPRRWTVGPLCRLGRVVTGNTPSRAVLEYFGDDIEWIKSDNINTPDHCVTHAREGLSPRGRMMGRTAPAGSTLMTCIAGSPNCIGNVALADREVAFNQQINAITPHDGVDYRFLYGLLLMGKPLVQKASTNSMKGMVSKGRLEQVRFPFPPFEVQRHFGAAFDRLLCLAKRQEAAQASFLTLFESLTTVLFRLEGDGALAGSRRRLQDAVRWSSHAAQPRHPEGTAPIPPDESC